MQPLTPQKQTPGVVRYGMLALLCLAAITAYAPRNSLGVAEKPLRSDLRLTEKQSGTVLSFFFFSYALLQVPAAWWCQRFGSRRALTLFAAGWSIASAAMGYFSSYWALIGCRLASGAAQAGLFSGTTASVAQWFPHDRRAFANGCIAGCMSLGQFLGNATGGMLLAHIGWRGMLVALAMPGFAWLVAFWFLFRDRPEDHAAVNAAELSLIRQQAQVEHAPAAKAEQIALGRIVRNPHVAWLCGQQFFRAAGQIFFGSWFTTYLRDARGITQDAQAGWLTGMPVMAIFFGSILGGWLSDLVFRKTQSRWWSRKIISMTATLTCAVLVAASMFVENINLAVLLICCGSFCGGVAGPCAYTVTIDMGGRQTAGVFALMNMAGNLGALALPYALPYIKEPWGWSAAFATFAGMYLLSALCWVGLNVDAKVAQA